MRVLETMNLRIDFMVLFLLVAGLAGCATPAQHAPAATVDMAEVAEKLDCPSSTTPACTTRAGRETRCFCTDEEALREILDPKSIR